MGDLAFSGSERLSRWSLPQECKMKGGDMHLETQTDILRFLVKSKPHKAV